MRNIILFILVLTTILLCSCSSDNSSKNGVQTSTVDSVYDEEYESLLLESQKYLEYELLEDNTYGVKLKDSEKETAIEKLIVPSVYEGLPVTVVLNNGFKNSLIKEVILPEGLHEIGYYAFAGSALETILINEGVTQIKSLAFRDCTELENISIPSSIETVGIDLFDQCSKLIFNSYGNAEYLGNSDEPYIYLFKATDYSISSVDIHDSTRFIGDWAFSECKSLSNITLSNNITTIGSHAFYGCEGLAEIIIPDNVTTVFGGAFRYCTSLTDITLSNSISAIYPELFRDCTSLKTVHIPESVTFIAFGAFYGCAELCDLRIPASVENFDNSIFRDCEKLTEISYDGTKTDWSRIEKGKAWSAGMLVTVVHCSDGDIAPSPENKEIAAAVLAEHIVKCVMSAEWLEDDYEYNSRDLFYFLVSLAMYDENFDHPYNDRIVLSDDENFFEISQYNASVINEQTFGVTDWEESDYCKELFDEQAQCYLTPNGIGIWRTPYSCANVKPYIRYGMVFVEFDLVSSDAYEEEYQEYGKYVMAFEETNLKFASFDTITSIPEEN